MAGFAGNTTMLLSGSNDNFAAITAQAVNPDDAVALAAARKGLQQAYAMAVSNETDSGSAAVAGARWEGSVITWSLADSVAPYAMQFSNYMDRRYEAAVQDAFVAWSAAMPGITFMEVDDTAQPDIRLGFGRFDTAASGIIGYTGYQVQDGRIAAGAVVRVEDPSENALVAGAEGGQTYAGTSATLSQVLQHEIGHALGLEDNADRSSVMYYALGEANRTLDATDVANIGALYGTGTELSLALNPWSLSGRLLEMHLSGSEGTALAGELAAEYGRESMFTGMVLSTASNVQNEVTLARQTNPLQVL